LNITWRLFKNLLFSLVSEESSFYAPYLAEQMRELREDAEEKQNEKPKVQVSLGEAMKELGV
jgi:hypothetical protein